MLSGVQVICFAASYGVSLALEVTRLLFRSGVRGMAMVLFAAAGLTAHTIYLFNRAVSAAGPPLSSQRDWCLMAAWVLAVVYLLLLWRRPKTAFGLFVLPSVLLLIGVGTFFADPRPIAAGPAGRFWGAVHSAALGGTAVAVVCGFATGVMYFVQLRRLKHKQLANIGLKLPSLEWLQRANSIAVGASAVLLALGVVAGWILNAIRRDGPLPWTDPLVLATMVMFVWLASAAVLVASPRHPLAGQRAAYAAIVGFILLLAAIGFLVSGWSAHGTAHQPTETRRTSVVHPTDVEPRMAP